MRKENKTSIFFSIAIGISLGLFFWILKSIIEVWTFQQEGFLQQVFYPNIDEVKTYFLITLVCILSVYIKISLDIQRKMERKLQEAENIMISNRQVEKINKSLEMEIAERKEVEEILRRVVEGTSSAIGETFFHSLVKHLAAVLKVKFAFISQLITSDRVKLCVFWNQDKFEDVFEYSIKDTPCEHVVGKNIACFPTNVQSQFPKDEWLQTAGIEGYLAIPLFDSTGKSLGHMGVMHNKEMVENIHAESVLRIFAARAGGEMERIIIEKEVEQRTKELHKSEQAKSSFLANINHELRSPLNAILGFSEIILNTGNLPVETQEHISIVHRSSEHLLTLINQVLDFSKIESGHMNLNEKNFDFHNMLCDLENMFSLKAKEKNLQLLFEFKQTPQYIYADEIKLRQILINLLSNAVKFTPKGSIYLQVEYDPAAVDTAKQFAKITKIVRIFLN